MNGVEYYIGGERTEDRPLRPYSPEALAFVAELSAALMQSPAARVYPDMMALAFWCRRSNLQKMQETCPEAEIRLGRGLCFHIAPGNVPINFAFSYLFGVLAGCANIVRLPSRAFTQIRLVCDALNDVLPRHPEIQRRTAFVRYPADDAITEQFSRMADVRVIWGGDETVARMKALTARPRCVDVAFADRYSLCVLNGRAVLELEQEGLSRLAENFYNDTYLMDQNACSSPQLICWLEDAPKARERFWQAVYAVAARKYELQAAVSVDKYTKMCEDAIELEAVSAVKRQGNLVYRAQLETLSGDLTALRGRGGYFYECALGGLEDLAPFVTEKYQTVTTFGLEPEQIRRFVTENRLRGIDRICPVGKAMDIGIFWDGYDLVRTLSRRIALG